MRSEKKNKQTKRNEKEQQQTPADKNRVDDAVIGNVLYDVDMPTLTNRGRIG